ncbi:hypothetical protein H257_13148 [Aphanomyces astaci]|uniref:HMG box domain-containing protein n=1 Tax=Aphanomyces astaci TaxID=112090 RepID=W4FW17_APHAT|nr:hypothetical protein H257_13148 [Aphanomyces astaci]ETV71720.1 hypothetical protein H257_13148 [Aphanomyces astaci]|eukprot:XP_009838908.1 hypothetical protein H257_13148 [Aphanomyces astaci]
MAAPVAAATADDDAYADLYEKFTYLQQQTNRLAAAYTLATQDLDTLHGDNKILKDKLLQIRVRRRNLAAQAQATMGANMNAKALFCRRNRRVLRKQFPLISREQLSVIVADEWESLPPDASEQWQREFMSYVPQPVPMAVKDEVVASRASGSSSVPSSSTPAMADTTTPLKKAPAKSRRKPPAKATTPAATPDDVVPKPKSRRATPKKKAETAPAASDKKPAKKPRPSPAKTTKATPKRTTQPKAKVAKQTSPAKKKDIAVAKDSDSDSNNSSMAPSDDDSDDNLMNLPTGAFG